MKEREITKSNYFETIEDIGLKNLPPVLKQVHTVISVKTDVGKDWSEYETNPEFNRMSDLAFTKLQEFIRTKHGLSGIRDEEPNKHNPYQGIGKEVYFIHRFLELNGKVVYKNTLEIYIDELQAAIQKKEISKKSPVAKEIMNIQKFLVDTFNRTVNAKHITIEPTAIKRLKTIIEKYENSYNDLDKDYTKKKKKKIDLKGLNGVKDSDILDSTEFIKMEFPALGFKDKWFDLIGDPCEGFTMMVYGMPKTGKSYLCVDFAGYLARNHGNVLYVAIEEKADSTLQKKIKEKEVAHPNLKITGDLPQDISSYKYVFLDSVNKLRLSPEDLERLKNKNKGISFVYVFQSTKNGQFKGNNEFKHDVDVVVEVPEIGKAVQYGRFNQGGTMNIFGKEPVQISLGTEDLSSNGLEGKPKKEKLNSTQKYFEKHKDNYDSDNPKFLFQSVSTPLLVDALKKEYDIEYVIRFELSNRGLDDNGNWVGFDKAKEIHKIN